MLCDVGLRSFDCKVAVFVFVCEDCLQCDSEFQAQVNKLKTTPTPNKNGSYGIKRGLAYAIVWGP